MDGFHVNFLLKHKHLVLCTQYFGTHTIAVLYLKWVEHQRARQHQVCEESDVWNSYSISFGQRVVV